MATRKKQKVKRKKRAKKADRELREIMDLARVAMEKLTKDEFGALIFAYKYIASQRLFDALQGRETD